ncbi:hypothetical protein [Methanoplanus limicola]|uniref:Uncharacterized protein n=1 Tax=Methanoplanus limicola DSM 2279 TaxID=937775 RepID=H1Z2U7_9EURY|nr:hypothetical protein [Methanoplanus limicola]EHQ34686.1 hypothetical protein Metlim_0552 [Methanoplanus limicola DSM 2279]
MKKLTIIKLILLSALVMAITATCGCTDNTKTEVYDENGNWIILPEDNRTDGPKGTHSEADFSEGKYDGLTIHTSPKSLIATEGGSATIEVTFLNKGDLPLKIGNYSPKFLIKDPSDISLPFGIIKRYSNGSDTVGIKPGENLTYEIIWDLTDEYGRNVSPGLYVLEMPDVMVWDGITEEKFTGVLGKAISEVMVKPDGEIMNEIIPVDTKREDEDITITFEKIDARPTGTDLLFSVLPKNPVYNITNEGGEVRTYTYSPDDKISGFYSIDGGKEKYLWNAELSGMNGELRTFTCTVEPLSVTYENISVNITSFGPVGGEWNFKKEI